MKPGHLLLILFLTALQANKVQAQPIYVNDDASGAREAMADAPLGLAPNPASTFLKAELPVATTKDFPVQVMDARGKLVAQALILNGEMLNVEALPQGMYLVKAAANGIVYTGRFVKQ